MPAPTSVLKVLPPVAFVVLVAAASLEAQPPRPDQPAPAERDGHAPAALVVWNRPIVVFRAAIGQVRPAERVATAVQRIGDLPDDGRPEEVRTEPATIGAWRGMLVFVRNHILFSVVEGDLQEGGAT